MQQLASPKCPPTFVSMLVRPEGRTLRGLRCLGRGVNGLCVSMLVRPEGRTLPREDVRAFGGRGVSMLVRPEGRTLPESFTKRISPS